MNIFIQESLDILYTIFGVNLTIFLLLAVALGASKLIIEFVYFIKDYSKLKIPKSTIMKIILNYSFLFENKRYQLVLFTEPKFKTQRLLELHSYMEGFEKDKKLIFCLPSVDFDSSIKVKANDFFHHTALIFHLAQERLNESIDYNEYRIHVDEVYKDFKVSKNELMSILKLI